LRRSLAEKAIVLLEKLNWYGKSESIAAEFVLFWKAEGGEKI
jgi:hypothetical protein